MIIFICAIIAAIRIWRRKKFKQKQLTNNSENNVNNNNFELNEGTERYDDISNEYEKSPYLKMNYNLDKYDFREYDKINYDELNVERNKVVGYTEILE